MQNRRNREPGGFERMHNRRDREHGRIEHVSLREIKLEKDTC